MRWDASTHRYARHSHEGYALGVVEAGAHAFWARGRVWTAVPGRVIIVNPEDAHDGGPAGRGDEYSYRMVYIDRALVETALVATPFFSKAVVSDAALAERMLDVHRAFEHPASRLECEARLIAAFVELAQRHGRAKLPDEGRSSSSAVGIARAYLAEHVADNCSLGELAAVAGVDRFHLLRAFRRQVGLPPHRYQTQLRLRQAKRLMLQGVPGAIAAATVGFADQSHMIRKFKAAYGVTPAMVSARCVKRAKDHQPQ